MISSPTITAGAAGNSNSKYSSVIYSALGLEIISILISYFSPRPGIIGKKCFQGLPLGSFKKNLTFNIYFLFIGVSRSRLFLILYKVHAKLYFHFTDLDRGLDVSVVGYISHDCVSVGTESTLKSRSRLEQEIAHGDICRLGSWLCAAKTLFYGNSLECPAKLL